MKSAEVALHDLTLALIYLTRQANTGNPDDFWKVDSFRAWKSYDWNTVDKASPTPKSARLYFIGGAKAD